MDIYTWNIWYTLDIPLSAREVSASRRDPFLNFEKKKPEWVIDTVHYALLNAGHGDEIESARRLGLLGVGTCKFKASHLIEKLIFKQEK